MAISLPGGTGGAGGPNQPYGPPQQQGEPLLVLPAIVFAEHGDPAPECPECPDCPECER